MVALFYRLSKILLCKKDISSIFIKTNAILLPAETKTVCNMVRYIMSFTVPEGREQSAQRVIERYFDSLHKHGPGGMRSQCYADYDKDGIFIHIKSFKKESIANHHFRSSTFQDYIQQLAALCGEAPSFSRLQQQKTFESIY